MVPRVPQNEPICPQCVCSEGLCTHHAKSVLPQLAQPGWYRLVGAQHYIDKRASVESPEAKKVRLRRERKRARAAERLLIAISGGFTRSRPAAEAA